MAHEEFPGPMMELHEGNYNHAKEKADKALQGQMCFICEWFNELIPIENKDGSSIDDQMKAFTRWGLMKDLESMLEENQESAKKDKDGKLKGPDPISVLIFSDESGFCEGIMEAVPEGRVSRTNIVTKDPSTIGVADLKQYIGVNGWDLIIYAYGIDPAETNEVDDIIDKQSAVLKLFLYLCQEIQKNKKACKKLAVLTAGAFSDERALHEEVGLRAVTHSTLFGMCNTVRLEMSVPVQVIDTEYYLTGELLPEIMSDIFRVQGFGSNTVRVLEHGRYVARQMPATPYTAREGGVNGGDGKWDVPMKGIIAITGGNGALGMVMGKWILDQTAAVAAANADRGVAAPKFTIKFLSRSMKISDQNAPAWAEIQEKSGTLGITCEQAKCDVSSRDSINEFLTSCDGQLTGMIHSAGVLQDAMMMNQTWEKFDTVFDSKSRAAYFLHEAMEKIPQPDLIFFWLFSSVAVYGNMGQTPYSASNAALDGLARHRRALKKPCCAIQWGGWGEVGMAANMDEANRRRMANSPMPSFTNKEGLRGLEQGLQTGMPYFSVFKYNTGVILKMVEDCNNATQSYMRNWTCKLAPLPTYDKQQMHSVLRSMFRKQSDALQFVTFTYDPSLFDD